MRLRGIILSLLLIPIVGVAQQITYSEPQKNVTDFKDIDVIGKIDDNLLVCKLIKNNYQLQVYDDQLKLKDKVNLDFIPAETYQIDFINYPNSFLIIFQAKEKKMIYSKVARLNKEGKLLGKIITLDSSMVRAWKGSFYHVITSENKKYILFSRGTKDLPGNKLQLEQIILNNNLLVEKNEKYFIPYTSNEEFVSDLNLDDEGNVVFITYSKPPNFKTNLTFYKASFTSADLEIKDIAINKVDLNLPQVRINNSKNLYYLISFYQNAETKNVEGLLSIILKKDLSDYASPLVYSFSDSFRSMVNKPYHSQEMIKNYFLKDIIFKEDGGFLLTGILIKKFLNTTYESSLASNRIYTIYPARRNRNSFVVTPNTIPLVYSYDKDVVESYDMRDPNSYRSFMHTLNSNTTPIDNKSNSRNAVDASTGNVLIFYIDKYNHCTNSTTLSNNETLTPFLPFYQVMNRGDKLFFIYNDKDKFNRTLLNSLSLNSDGTLIVYPLFRNLDKGYTFLTEYGKQIDNTIMIMPCINNNKVAFGMIRFE